ncbi:hypothetical protein BgAZ_100620 [Babesia gibsoni]|uniref:Cytochrome oxidase subunit II copper A binding domain-containing protein n=1 Tax=Babesia gibsoni TaxID=33632 RepID=A0AAD8PF09_BABGI|nr:hypothetical protein BgAZ_100620 [Babesia gibsoni]
MTNFASVLRRTVGFSRATENHICRSICGASRPLTSQVDPILHGRFNVPSRYLYVHGAQFSVKAGGNKAQPEAAKGKKAAAPEHAGDPDAKFCKGKFPGLGLPKPVGQPEDLPSIEFGKPTGMYNFVRHQHGDPRGHLLNDGRYKDSYDTDGFHWYDAYTDVPKQKFTIVNGETMIMGKETRPMEELFGVEQTNIPFYPRRRLNLWGNHGIVLRAEYCFFWIPTFIILSLAVPCYTMIYMMDEAVDTSMTVKVVGHQWYWVYEVESPPLVE